ncbi:DUF3987 domain-containing protein [Flavobacteriaceae bacterium]|nr:DUF3987 domain-containing protein [Flavobacteriaceae bacterium]
MEKTTMFLNFRDSKGNHELVKVLNAIKDGKFSKEIDQLREADSEEEKGRIKNSLLAFTPSVELNTGRTFTEGDSYSSIIHLDYDKLEDVTGALKKIKALDYTYSCFVSPSGNGIKVFVRVSNKMEQHEDAFNTLKSYYDKAVGVEYDKSIKDLCRLCFVSSDPNLYINEESEVFDYTTISMTRTPEELWEYTSRKETFTVGNRNNFIFTFACNTNRYGLNIEEVQSYCSSYTDSTLTYSEIEKTIRSAYENNTSQFAEMQSVQFVQSCSKEDKSPMIPEEVYENLPSTLKESCAVFKGRERDVYLTSALCVISGGLSNMQGLYAQKIVYPNLYSFIIAPAASGKGSMNYARSLGDCYQTLLESKNNEAKATYVKEIEVYNFKKKMAKKEEDIRDLKKPEEPKFKTFFIPGNTSSAMIHKHLEFNEGTGCICESEADTITNALKQEWGGFNDVLRKAFHNETILSSRRADFEYIKIEEPKLSLSITGTPDQVEGILNSTQNGLASRFMFYSFYTPPKWKKTFTKNISHSKQNQFMKFTQDLCNKFSSQGIRLFNTTESQHDKLDNIFSETLDEKYQLHSGDSSSLVFRLGEITYKIAMVLSAVRTDESEIECEDRDFDTAMKLTEVYLVHGLNVFEKINNRENKLPLNEERWMNKLPKEFTTGEAIIIATKLGIAERTVYKKLRDYVENELLKKIKTAVYRKLSKN